MVSWCCFLQLCALLGFTLISIPNPLWWEVRISLETCYVWPSLSPPLLWAIHSCLLLCSYSETYCLHLLAQPLPCWRYSWAKAIFLWFLKKRGRLTSNSRKNRKQKIPTTFWGTLIPGGSCLLCIFCFCLIKTPSLLFLVKINQF